MQGVISTPHREATEAGKDIFSRGGNAVDAALAAAAVLTVVYPHQCALGGDLFALVDNGAGCVTAVNGSGAAAENSDADAMRERYGQVPDAGPDAITVPGLVAGWQSLSEQAGQLSWEYLLQPAIKLAEEGVSVSRSLAAGIQYRTPAMDGGMRNLFLPGGQPLVEGDVLVQLALAKTLQILATQGGESFYRGELSIRLAAGLERLGCVVSLPDLQQHKTELTQPLSFEYRGFELLTSPPNSQGFTLLQTLAALEAVGAGLDSHGPEATYLLHACLMAVADRDSFLGDPRRVELPLDRLLDKRLLAQRMLTRSKSLPGALSENQPAHGDTVAVCAMDSEGRAVSLIQSLFQTFGAAVLEEETGVIFHNRARGFSLDKNAPNYMVQGSRPAHSLMPLLLRQQGTTLASLGTMGGKAQPQILAQLLAGAMDLNSDLNEVLANPRWVFGARDIDFPRPTVAIESDAPAELDDYLAISGLDVSRIDSCSESVGHAQIVRRQADMTLAGASDPRSDGSAVAYAGS